jgi:hypothetical protein
MEDCLAKDRALILISNPNRSVVCQANFINALANVDKPATMAKTSRRYLASCDQTT